MWTEEDDSLFESGLSYLATLAAFMGVSWILLGKSPASYLGFYLLFLAWMWVLASMPVS